MRTRTWWLSALLILLALALASCSNKTKDNLEEYLDDLDKLVEENDGSLKFDQKGTTLEDFKIRVEGRTVFKAEEIKFDEFSEFDVDDEDEIIEHLSMRIKKGEGQLGFLPGVAQVLDLMSYTFFDADEEFDLVVKYDLDDDVFKLSTFELKMQDRYEMAIKYEIESYADDDEIKKYEMSLKIHKDFREDAEDALERLKDEWDEVADNADDEDLVKALEKLIEFAKDPESVKITLSPKKPTEWDGWSDEKQLEDLRIKVK